MKFSYSNLACGFYVPLFQLRLRGFQTQILFSYFSDECGDYGVGAESNTDYAL